MSNSCIILREIENLSQRVADFLTRSGSLRGSAVRRLIDEIERIIGKARGLPLARRQKEDIINRLLQAIRILQDGRRGLDKVERVLAVLSILQVVALKVKNRKIPCTQGFTIVHPSNVFSTICQCCC